MCTWARLQNFSAFHKDGQKLLKQALKASLTNSVDPDQTAPAAAV